MVFAVLSLAACGRSGGPAPVTVHGLKVEKGPGYATVRGGETLWQIAQQYRLPMRDIIEVNNLKPPYPLRPGQRLKLPPPREYEVRYGDTLYSVSRLFGVDTRELAQLNNLKTPYQIHYRQRLRIPSASQQYSKRAAVKAASRPSPPTPGAKPSGSSTARTASASAGRRTPAPPPVPRSSERFMWPVRGPVLSTYGPKDGGLHNDGINIAAPRGTPVRAAENGTVVYVGEELRSFGRLVLVRHSDGWMSAYGHLDKALVGRDDKVTRGQSIGAVGTSGTVDSPQLHFELRKGSRAVDPQKHLDRK